MTAPVPKRAFLFLQGPHGPLFARLGAALAAQGHGVFRINLNGGDQADWPAAAAAYRGTLRAWPLYFDDFVVDHAITDVILFGDCRPHHSSAHGMARLRQIRVHVLEEGYIRPDFMTLQEDGVNGNSTLPREPAWYRAEAAILPEPGVPAAVPSSFQRRVRETSRYMLLAALSRPLFPFYRSHRPHAVAAEAAGWALRYLVRGVADEHARRTWSAVRDKPYFALPLQLNSDYQLRVHSPFGDMRGALRFVMKSFARSAPPDVNLIVKRHPLDASMTRWDALVRYLGDRYGISDRVHYLGKGDTAEVVRRARGVVTVNSTVGTLALNSGVPTAVLGEAIYNIPGIVHHGALDAFWDAPRPPDLSLYDAFRRVLIDRCLIPGGYLSEEGVAMLVDHAQRRLTARLPAGMAPANGASPWH